MNVLPDFWGSGAKAKATRDGQRDGHDRERGEVEEQADREGSDATISDYAQEDAEWLLRVARDAAPP